MLQYLWRSCEGTHHGYDVLLLSLHIITLISTLIAERHSWFRTDETKLLWTHDAILCCVTATLDTRHERQTFFWPVLAIFWLTFLRFHTRVIRNRYWYWWYMNETRSAFVEPDITRHFIMGYCTFMHVFVIEAALLRLIEKAVWACNTLRNNAKAKFWLDIFLMVTSQFFICQIFTFYIYSYILQYFQK